MEDRYTWWPSPRTVSKTSNELVVAFYTHRTESRHLRFHPMCDPSLEATHSPALVLFCTESGSFGRLFSIDAVYPTVVIGENYDTGISYADALYLYVQWLIVDEDAQSLSNLDDLVAMAARRALEARGPKCAGLVALIDG